MKYNVGDLVRIDFPKSVSDSDLWIIIEIIQKADNVYYFPYIVQQVNGSIRAGIRETDILVKVSHGLYDIKKRHCLWILK